MKNRTANSVWNIKIALLTQTIMVLLQFVNRYVFVHLLSAEYLGLNGLFTNVLSLLSLAELGIGGAMTYALYKPIKDGDVERIKTLMAFYRKAYNLIGSVVIVLGAIITPLLRYIIKEIPNDMPLIHVYYLMYVLNIGVSYFFTYKRTIIICDQRQYVSSISTSIKSIALAFGQIIILIATNNYLMYLIVMLVTTVGENIAISLIADRLYPFLKEKNVETLRKDELNEIKRNVMAMFCHKVGSVIVTSTDNIIISKFVSLTMTGIYSNYTLVINALNNLLNQVFGAVTASVGNLVANGDKKHDEEVFGAILLGNIWIYSVCSACLFCLFEDFIRLWVGEKYQIGLLTVGSIVLVFYLTGIRKSVMLFRDAAGIFYHDRYKAIFEAAVNLITSVPLALHYGVHGTLLGTVISTLSVSFWVEARVLYKYHFHKPVIGYFIRQLLYFLCAIGVTGITYVVGGKIPCEGVIGFIFKGATCMCVANAMCLVFFFSSKEFDYCYKALVKKKR